MKIGYPNNPRKDVMEEIKWIAEHFDFIDFFMEPDKAYYDVIDAELVRKTLNEYDIGIVGHTPYYLPFSSPIEVIRKIAIEEAEKCFNAFEKLGADFVTVHGGWPPSLFNAKEGIELQIESFKILLERAEKYGIKLMYESGVKELDNYTNVAKIMQALPKLYFHLDVGHVSLHGRDACKFIRRLHTKIKHIHIHDNFGKDDLHLPIGTGKIKWENVIRELKKYYDGTITLEIFSDREYVLLAKKRFEEMWRSL
ncbi:MAG TPA: sugar phosphate isomerase/epimerase [Thermoplasmatales archaeon]|nr:sugar phosphate isomerase/epimerase [Thermoplasmatales archaeon]